jgi:hypothetical protein
MIGCSDVDRLLDMGRAYCGTDPIATALGNIVAGASLATISNPLCVLMPHDSVIVAASRQNASPDPTTNDL